MTNSSPLTVTLRVDWGTGPFWVLAGESRIPDPYDVDEIGEVVPLSAELLTEVAAWDQSFQETYNEEQPQESGFRTGEKLGRFDERGRELARKLRSEVPVEVQIRYEPLGTGIAEVIS
ncbi:hypothetical protein [Goodfellowiella coeruleoviolacea]|uniref:Uncharacterized protein n=1 Tax=Goodfellowiella coeruleoviolacea TaxID=334858 RepID=A0AAE3GAW7_9PSEU|nr:hypothetical protein [Goodfellowiella coeruleoviolacea]MCP2164881.1 hypothetical protein [Goodfellowiella coeruleoviolacea]